MSVKRFLFLCLTDCVNVVMKDRSSESVLDIAAAKLVVAMLSGFSLNESISNLARACSFLFKKRATFVVCSSILGMLQVCE